MPKIPHGKICLNESYSFLLVGKAHAVIHLPKASTLTNLGSPTGSEELNGTAPSRVIRLDKGNNSKGLRSDDQSECF